MNNRKYILAWIVIYFFTSCAIFTGYAVAQDTTPTPETTQVVGEQPQSTLVATEPHDTATPPENPQGTFMWADLLPYAIPIVLILVLAFLVMFGTTAVLLYKSAPPALQAVSLSVINTLLAQLKSYATSTPDELDDKIVDMIEAKVRELLVQTAKMGSLN